MSAERDLLWRIQQVLQGERDDYGFVGEIEELLAQPEHIPDVGNMVEPVAWVTEWVQRYRNNDTPIMDRAVSFTKGAAPAVPNPNYIPLYTSPPTREPLSEDVIWDNMPENPMECSALAFIRGVKFAEKAHGIGEQK